MSGGLTARHSAVTGGVALTVAMLVANGANYATNAIAARWSDRAGFADASLIVTMFLGATILGYCQPTASSGQSGWPYPVLPYRQFLWCFELEPGGSPIDAAVEDVSGDGRADIVVSVSGDESVKVFYQNSSGGFDPFASRAVPLGSGSSGQVRVAAGDVSGDSRADLLLVRPQAGEIRIVRAR